MGEVDNANRAKDYFGDKHNYFFSNNVNSDFNLKKENDKSQDNEELLRSKSILNP